MGSSPPRLGAGTWQDFLQQDLRVSDLCRETSARRRQLPLAQALAHPQPGTKGKRNLSSFLWGGRALLPGTSLPFETLLRPDIRNHDPTRGGTAKGKRNSLL